MKLVNIFEELSVDGNSVKLVKPYDKVRKFNVGNREVYALFGNVDYYNNRESILAIKGKSNILELNGKSYNNFLRVLRDRFYDIVSLAGSDVLVSLETSSNINDDIMKVIGKPSIKDGFKKTDINFKMRGIPKGDRGNITGLFNLDFELGGSICVVDDFITTGSSFRNAFSVIPDDINAVGICLFRLKD
jgi:hypothetical protein